VIRWQVPALLAGLTMLAPAAAWATQTTYDYHIEHPRYGDIGTYTNVVKDFGDSIEVDSEIHVAVRVFGMVMYREEGTRTEHWQGNRLVGFDSVTVTNGTRIEVHGEAKGDAFVLTTPSGTIEAPPQVHPSNPWALQVLDTDMVMSTKSGRVERVNVSGGELESVNFDGKELRLHRYDVVGTKREQVWLDDRGVSVAFRTEDEGSKIDFVLSEPPIIKNESHAQN